MPRWPAPTYQIRVVFRAPLRFVFDWCTDYRSDDARRAGEDYDRRIISRGPRRVVYEDLWWKPDGWRWRRNEVHLDPPTRWHSESIGTYRDADLDYRLRSLESGRTELALRVRRRPGPRDPRQPAKRTLERELRKLWGNYRRALEEDYRAARGSKRRRTGARPTRGGPSSPAPRAAGRLA